MNPLADLFIRSEITALTGVDDSTLNYWMREGVLAWSSGGTTRGSRRRFDFRQVNIAAALGAMGGLRPSIGPLRSLGALLQSAVRLGDAGTLHPSNYLEAARLATALADFHAGIDVPVRLNRIGSRPPEGMTGARLSEWYEARRPAVSSEEVRAHILTVEPDHDSRERIVEVAQRIQPHSEDLARIYATLTYDVLAPGYACRHNWLLTLGTDASWQVTIIQDGETFSADRADAAAPAIFLPVQAIIQRVWGIKSTEERLAERGAAALTAEAA